MYLNTHYSWYRWCATVRDRVTAVPWKSLACRSYYRVG